MLASAILLSLTTLLGSSPAASGLQRESALHLPAGARVLHLFDGEEQDHLGIGVAALGDVDGDGIGDLALGAMTGAYTFCFGPGYVRVVSGRTGATLYRVDGTRGEIEDSGDAFGDTIVALGDLDGDGAGDFAVSAWRWENYRGYMALYSGCDGAPLATVYGPRSRDAEPGVVMGAGPRPPSVTGDIGSGSDGGISSLGDVDGDGVDDFSVGSFLFSGAELRPLRRLTRSPMARTGDVDGDGVDDLLEYPGYPRHRSAIAVLGTVDGRELAVLGMPDTPGLERSSAAVGDVDGDGFVDLLIQTREAERLTTLVASRRVYRRARVLSGRDGTLLFEWVLDHPKLRQVQLACGVGDLDGDGKGELWIALDLGEAGCCVRVRSGADGRVLCELRASHWSFGARVANAGDLDGDGRPELLVGEYESQTAARCAGRAYVISLGL